MLCGLWSGPTLEWAAGAGNAVREAPGSINVSCISINIILLLVGRRGRPAPTSIRMSQEGSRQMQHLRPEAPYATDAQPAAHYHFHIQYSQSL